MTDSALPCLLLMLGLFRNGLTALIQTQQTVLAAEGDEAHLNCQLFQYKDVHQVTWQKLFPEGLKKNIATYSKYFGQRVNAGFEEKVKFKDAGLQNSSIILMKVTEKDEGCYQCMFNTYPEGALTGTTCLKLTFGLAALIKTQRTVNASVGDEALLNCQLIHFKDALQVTWRKLLPKGEKSLASYGKDFSPKVNPDFRDKLELKDVGLQNSSIVIKKVTEQDEGCYNCLFTYPEGVLTNTTCLKVYGFDDESASHDSGFYFITVASVLSLMAACGFVAGAVLFIQKIKSSLSHGNSEETEMDETVEDANENAEENAMDKAIKDTNEPGTALISPEKTRDLTPEKNVESDIPKQPFAASRRLYFDPCE